MSYAIIRNTKYKRENLKGIFRHNERKNRNYSNKNIDKEKENEVISNNVKITASGAISPKLLLMSQCLIKIIIQLDYEKTIINKEDYSEDEAKK